MKLIDQKSEPEWELVSSFGGPVYVRSHYLTLKAAISDTNFRAICDATNKPNMTEYGGVAATYLLLQDFSCERSVDCWDIRATLLQATLPWVRPFRVLDIATGEVRDVDAKLYGDPIEFRDVLPTCRPFPACQQFDPLSVPTA